MIEINDLMVTAAEGTVGSALKARSGRRVLITGPSNSGKTRFCLALCGLQDDGEGRDALLDGVRISALPERERTQAIAYVPSDPTWLFSGARTTLAGELELSTCLLGAGGLEPAIAIAEVASAFDLGPYLDRDPFSLSGGEAVRAGLALAVLRRPRLLVIDQAFEFLDPDALATVRRGLDRYLPADTILIETSTRPETGLDCATPDLVATHGCWTVSVRERGSTGEFAAVEDLTQPVGSLAAAEGPAARQFVLQADQLSYVYPAGGFRLRPVDLMLRDGDRLVLTGANGVGKTTLLRCLALLLDASYGSLAIRGQHGAVATPPSRRRRHEWARSALYCFQRPDDQLYLPTVEMEVMETARRLGRADARPVGLQVADRLGLSPHLQSPPLDLPRSLRRMVPIAAALAARPPVLLLDEPSAGLDLTQMGMLCNALASGTYASAMVIVTHDHAFAERVATSTLRMV